MAAVMAKPAGTATKMKKPPAPMVQTNMNGVSRTSAPSASPSSARKTLPGQNHTPTSATSNSAAANGASRPNRRLQRLTTRNNPAESSAQEKRIKKNYPEPYVPKEAHILRKYKAAAPSLIVHLHPTHFRFDQQDGSFSYHSEMRVFIEHLGKGTIPHDMVDEFRKAEVKYYDGWLIVRVIDHKSVAKHAAASGAAAEDEEPFSIHNYNQYITPSPYAPYPQKELSVAKSPPLKQEQGDAKDPGNPFQVTNKSFKPQPLVYHVALRPTILSKHMDLVMDAMAPDPKSLNRKQSQANVNGRAPGAPQTPGGGVPPTPSSDRPPPLKKQKLKIDPKDMLEYEGRVINATAPPLFLDPVDSLEEAESLRQMMTDPLHDQRPPSPKSRKRTVAELAAEDAQAKQQERFMLLMDERSAGTNGAGNAGAVDTQAAAAMFQPRFEKFNALDNIKHEIAERKQREKDRQLQDDETRRLQQDRLQEENDKKRLQMQRVQEQRMLRARQQEAMQAQQAQQVQAAQRPPSQQVNGLPPNMQAQVMAAQQRGSPVIRQGTPHAVSSPIVANAGQNGMAGSQQGHGSPARPGSAIPHGHPMARGPSGQGPSRNGTPQIPHGTPAQRHGTPVLRQGTPAQSVTHASPHGQTPQMMPVGLMPGLNGQMPNGVPRQITPQQAATMQAHRQALQQQQAVVHAQQQAAMQQQMANGTPQMSPAQVAHMQAQHHAALARQQQQQAMQQQQGTPQQAHMSPAPGQTKSYNQALSDAMKTQMHQLQQAQHGGQGSPAQQPTPQQQQAHMMQVQAQQQRMMQAAQQAQNQGQQMMPNQHPQQPNGQHPQQRGPTDEATKAYYTKAYNTYQLRLMQQVATKYSGNTAMITPQEMQNIRNQAQVAASQQLQKARVQAAQAQQGGGGQQMTPQQAQQIQQMQAMQARQQQMAAQQNGMPSQGQQGVGNQQHMAAMLQQQQAQQMQQMQMQHAQQMMAAQAQQQQNLQFQQGQGGQGGR